MFLIDVQDKDPIYIQIQNQIEKFIQAGILKAGDKLPSVRSLAQDNGINPNTVARAYTQLEQNGTVYNIPKKGVYVADRKPAETDSRITELIRHLKENGVRKEELLEVIHEVYGEESDA